MTPRRRRDDNGGIALLTLCGGMVLLMTGLLVLSAVADVGVAAARARTAADAAALAAVSPPLTPSTPSTSMVDGCDAARRLAEVNGASLTSCRLPAAGAVLVEVVVRPRQPFVQRLVGDLPARAAAVLEPAP